jgi:glucosyl-3-phosphoglycerate synthase
VDFVQERIATVHDLGDAPAVDSPLDRTAVVVPIAAGDRGAAADRVLSRLDERSPARIVVPFRAAPDAAAATRSWLDGFDHVVPLWCDAPRLVDRLADHGLDGGTGKGHDVWLALGVATAATSVDRVVIRDADAPGAVIDRLLAPLEHGFALSKGYYARVEGGRLYGRLCRLLYEPLVWALADAAAPDAALVDYLDAFRYALSGEAAMTADLARRLRAERGFGFEVGTIGGAYRTVGPEGVVQVDLGQHVHDHRPVRGDDGLERIAEPVAAALLRLIEDTGARPAYDDLRDRYRETAHRLIDRYAVDARCNGIAYDPASEREQVRLYADAVVPPGPDDRLPAWTETGLDPERVATATRPEPDA